MKKFAFLIISILLISCGTTKKTSIKDEYNAKQDLNKIEYSGGNGNSIENAIIILKAKNSYEGIPAEYAYIEKLYGKRSVDWMFISQSLVSKKNKHYDVLTIVKLPSKKEMIIYFDISNFYGKY